MRISDGSSDVCSSDLKVDADLLKEAYVEHDGAKVLINDILASGPEDEYFEAKVTVLSEEIKHHVKEEEKQHDNMFQQARAAEVDLDALGEQLLARKEELTRQAETAGRSEEHTSELPSLMRISSAVSCSPHNQPPPHP